MPTAAPHVTANDNTIAFQSNANRFVKVSHTSLLTQNAASFQGEDIWRTPGVWSHLWARIVTNTRDDAAAIVSRINNSAGNQALDIPAGTTGDFQDTTNSDTLAEDDEVSYRVNSQHSVITTTGFDISAICSLFTATSGQRVYRLGADGASMPVPPSSGFMPLLTSGSAYLLASEASLQTYLPSGVLRQPSIFVRIHSGGSGNTFTLRVNEEDTDVVLSIPAGTTGHFHDDSNVASISDLARVDWAFVNTTTNNLFGFEYINIDLITDVFFGGFVRGDSPCVLNADAGGARQDGFALLSGLPQTNQTTTEANCQVPALVADLWGGLLAYVDANGQNGAAYMQGRVNGAYAGFQLTVPAGTTGLFIAEGDPVNVAAGDLLSQRRYVEGDSATDLEFHQQNFWIRPEDEEVDLPNACPLPGPSSVAGSCAKVIPNPTGV